MFFFKHKFTTAKCGETYTVYFDNFVAYTTRKLTKLSSYFENKRFIYLS